MADKVKFKAFPTAFKSPVARRMGGAKRYPSSRYVIVVMLTSSHGRLLVVAFG
jgi:hypothetical protein